MSDLERELRQIAIERLTKYCECEELAPVKLLGDERGEVDILGRPKVDGLTDLCVAFEIKALVLISDGRLGPWIKQAADYVGSSPANGWPKVVAGFVWLADAELTEHAETRTRIDGMFQLAQHFRVGHASIVGRKGLCMVFGPSASVFQESRGGWLPRAKTLLLARRQSGGTRRPIRSMLSNSTSAPPSFDIQ